MSLPDPENHKFNVTLPRGYYEKLRIWAQSEQGYAASKAAYILQTAIDEAEAEGKIPTEDQPTTEDLEKIKEYIDLLLGNRSRNGISYTLVAEVLKKSSKELEQLYIELEQCRKNKLHNEQFHH